MRVPEPDFDDLIQDALDRIYHAEGWAWEPALEDPDPADELNFV